MSLGQAQGKHLGVDDETNRIHNLTEMCTITRRSELGHVVPHKEAWKQADPYTPSGMAGLADSCGEGWGLEVPYRAPL